ncbi:right-handed parallel beta-helix repeat-containing protein [Paenibacillus turpanensis]|uniref:right-handed parallel beta-helix repeat-containing protein n=1 Tax=Paenibacillus turpanensis TaxID=2689078 RepID=UPI00140E6D59|nr:NosD domain-containing protein [Paenibacillus turpanensis]
MPLPVTADSAKPMSMSLQARIDAAKENDTLLLEAGHYEGPIAISKTLHLKVAEGTEVVLVNSSEAPAVHISANGVSIEGLNIRDEALKKEPTVLVQADGVRLERLQIQTGAYGIKMIEADRSEILHSTVVWAGGTGDSVKLSDKGNGIDLYESHGNRLAGNRISGMHDGIYLENSDENRIESNYFEGLRYGVHCMYTKGTSIRQNIGVLNITGAMVMAVQNVELIGNTFEKQSENVNSQGILLFDAHRSVVQNNRVEGNRVGLYVEQSADNVIKGNDVIGNFIGLQLLDAKQNHFTENNFIGNVVPAEAKNSVGNAVNGNYWDSFQGIDADGDGKSNIAFAMNPFFLSLSKARPGFQLLFQSPGMVFLEGLYQSERNTWTSDASPLMNPAPSSNVIMEGKTSAVPGIVGGLLLILAAATILIARRREG